MIIFETPCLLLRLLTSDDLEAVTTLYSDPIVMASKGGIRSPEQTEQHVKGYIEEYSSAGYCFWAVIHRQNNRFIGLCGLLNQQNVDGQAEIEVAYTIAKEYWNQGLATESAQACKQYGFHVLGLKRLVSLIAHDNIPSQRVAIKNGMFYEKDFVDKKGRTMRIYAVHRPLRFSSNLASPLILWPNPPRAKLCRLIRARLWRVRRIPLLILQMLTGKAPPNSPL